ncbi:MAG: DNA-formamidopyrimidine glycosylase [Bacillota bacterium]|nr:DNA-formamidopyrimidine glycosylase [Bacillota bacterium]
MPELPEVECIVRDLRECLTGKLIKSIDFLFFQMLRGAKPEDFRRQICGKIISQVKRRGKYILIFLSGDTVLEIHLRMTGRLLFHSVPVSPGKYTGVIFYFENGEQLHFEDIRKFGTFTLYEKGEQLRSFLLGSDPVEDEFSEELFLKILEKRPNSMIKSFLLDQRNIAGLGNIYTDESLFMAGIHPSRKVNNLSSGEKKYLFNAVCHTLKEGILFRGTSFSDYRDLWGNEGEFQKKLKVYQRGGEPCVRCKCLLERIVIAGRGTYICPSCQPL